MTRRKPYIKPPKQRIDLDTRKILMPRQKGIHKYVGLSKHDKVEPLFGEGSEPEAFRSHTYGKQPRRLVRTDFVSPQEKEKARDRGEFYIEEGKGETSTLESLRLDTTTKNQLKLMEKWSPKVMGKQMDKSGIVRYAIHKLFKEWDKQIKSQR